MNEPSIIPVNRRSFLRRSGGILSGVALAGALDPARYAHGASTSEELKIALVGCGGRGSGAASQALKTQNLGPVKLVAVADVFEDRLKGALGNLTSQHKEHVKVDKESQFIGFDAYKKAIAMADVVILTTPPGFRPMMFEEAIAQGKHVFMEKPVATDAAGVNRVLAAAKIAKEKNLKVGVGLQRHHSKGYIETIKRIHDGAIGDITSARCYWNGATPWLKKRADLEKAAGRKLTEMEYQMRNWYYFNWLCGDHITEQHIHNLDVINWFKGSYPVKAQGMGGREVRKGKDHGEIFDHHFVEFTYADGSILNSQCRHIPKTSAKVDELFIGTKGKIYCGAANIRDHQGNVMYQFDKKSENNGYQNEHVELFAAIAKGEYKFADAENGAKSTMTSILGRMATYSGQVVEWDKALNCGLNLQPAAYTWDTLPKSLPDADGKYKIAVPGVTRYY